MPYEIALTYIDLPLFYNVDLDHIVKQISKIMGQNRVTREPYDKEILISKKYITMKKHHLFCYQKNHFLTYKQWI